LKHKIYFFITLFWISTTCIGQINIDVPCQDLPFEGNYLLEDESINGKSSYLKALTAADCSAATSAERCNIPKNYKIYWDSSQWVLASESACTWNTDGDFGVCEFGPGSNLNSTLVATNSATTNEPPTTNWVFTPPLNCDPIFSGPTLSFGNFDYIFSNLSITPNPFKNQFTIAINEEAMATIYDIVGIQVGMQKLLFGDNIINTENLDTGMYLVQIANEKGTQTVKMLKQ
jgi:hypothetical protein